MQGMCHDIMARKTSSETLLLSINLNGNYCRIRTSNIKFCSKFELVQHKQKETSETHNPQKYTQSIFTSDRIADNDT